MLIQPVLEQLTTLGLSGFRAALEAQQESVAELPRFGG